LEEGVYGRSVDRAEHHCGRCSIAYELIKEQLGDPPCIHRVREPPFRWKRVVLQPIQQLSPTRTDNVSLRVVDMRIDEAGDEDAVGVPYDLEVCRQIWQQFLSWAYCCYATVTCDEQAILEKLEAAGIVSRAGVGTEVEDGAPVRARFCEVSAGRHGRSKLAFRFAPLR